MCGRTFAKFGLVLGGMALRSTGGRLKTIPVPGETTCCTPACGGRGPSNDGCPTCAVKGGLHKKKYHK